MDQCFIILGTLCRGFLRHFAHKWGKPFSGFRKSCAGCSTFPVKMGKSESSHSTTPPPRRPQRVTNVALPRWPPLARSPLEARWVLVSPITDFRVNEGVFRNDIAFAAGRVRERHAKACRGTDLTLRPILMRKLVTQGQSQKRGMHGVSL